MDYYKIRLKLVKSSLPKLKEEDLQWQAVKNMIRDGKAEIVLAEKSDAEFERPDDLKQFGQWKTKFASDLFFEATMLLSETEVVDEEIIMNRFYSNLQHCNFLDYSYSTNEGRFESFGYYDDSETDFAEMVSKEEKAVAKKEADEKKNTESKLTPEEIAQKKQIKMFKNKK